MNLRDELKALESDCLAKIGRRVRDPLLRTALTFAQRAQRALRFGKLAHAEFNGFLSPRELCALAAWLPPTLREIAAEGASACAVSAPTLSFYPLLPWNHPQRWRANDTAFLPPQRGAQGAYHAMYVVLTAPGDPFDIAPFLKPHRLRFDADGLRTQAVAMHQNIDRARRRIRAVAPPLAHALQFECSRAGKLRYVGKTHIYAPTPDEIARLPRLGEPPQRPRAVNFSA